MIHYVWFSGRLPSVLAVLVLLHGITGCRLIRHFPPPSRTVAWPSEGLDSERSSSFLRIARDLSQANDSRSVDYYFQAAALSWSALSEHPSLACPQHPAWGIYQASLEGLLVDAARFHRLDSSGQLQIYQPLGLVCIPVTSSSLDWPVEQVTDMQVPDKTRRKKLKRTFAKSGLGVPIVALRTKPYGSEDNPVERFIPDRVPLAATAVLRADSEMPSGFAIELVNPSRVNAIQVENSWIPIAKDLSSPLEFQLQNKPTNPLAGFLLPGSGVEDDGLRMSEPYQPGKVPVVFIHGLMSEPVTWMDMLNQLRTLDWFNERYQVWGFSYATGSPFVTSAMRLRNHCREALSTLDPLSEDPALQEMVLIGHSMGGLLSKLQISASGDDVWNSVSKVPLDHIRVPNHVREELRERMVFEPQPYVRRVIYIATPHQGSSFASRGVGRIASSLVQPDEQYQSLHRRLVSDNPNTFFGTFRKRIPTSVDLLEPNDATLKAIYSLPVSPHVRQHTIFGTGDGPWTLGMNDGVVSVASACHPCAVSEAQVDGCHTKILQHEATIAEVIRLLIVHLQESVLESGDGLQTRDIKGVEIQNSP
ncbi:hypothetical protein VN12_11130 [Pirellula sp. SH-Sr6A]|uniref:esterase/lipase family protein n=1 Tax=Pirellula sp. SH-Sr6A TaxID=1632865 RepID=UPI00078B98C5|nr:hypothetical protein [Pirellula sp. SH-Sr6A]AMV32669.1 hypothetical protein VN12_11130 [Pirellula sp. SH-Sr6A]